MIQRPVAETNHPFGPFEHNKDLSKSLKKVLDAKSDITKSVSFLSEPDWMSSVLQHQHNLRVLFNELWRQITSRSSRCSEMEHELVYRDMRQSYGLFSAVIDSAGEMPAQMAMGLIGQAFGLLDSVNAYGQLLVRRSYQLENESSSANTETTDLTHPSKVLDFLSLTDRDRTL